MSTTAATRPIRARLDATACQAQTAAEALDATPTPAGGHPGGNGHASGTPALDLPKGTLAGILAALDALDVCLDLALDELTDALDPVGVPLAPAGRTG